MVVRVPPGALDQMSERDYILGWTTNRVHLTPAQMGSAEFRAAAGGAEGGMHGGEL